MGNEPSLAFLDFDGVICDSLEECFYSSAIAYYRLAMGGEVPSFDETYRGSYRALRPFVRNGEDYLLIHQLVREGKTCVSQAEFDLVRRSAKPGALEDYLELFTLTRRDLVANEHSRWISLNPVYPFMRALLPGLGARGGAYILSTKKKEFILEILAACGVEWPAKRILSMQDSPKLGAIAELLEKTGARRAIFIDDQIEHLSGASDPRVSRYLALWGYALADAETAGVRKIGAQEGESLLRGFLDRAP